MNEVENEILKYFKKDDKKIIFDVGCYRGNFTKNFINNEKKINVKSNFFLFDPNPNVKNYLTPLLNDNDIKYFDIAILLETRRIKITLGFRIYQLHNS